MVDLSIPQNEIDEQLGERAPLPCLNSNISTEMSIKGLPKLSTQHRKTAFILKSSVESLSGRFGVQNLGFLTLTFADHVVDPKVAQKRFNSLVSHVIKKRYREYLGVFERQKSGRIHYHLLLVLEHDIRTGINFDELASSNYRSASKPLRDEWVFWRKTAKKYGFGRTELLPVRSNVEAMAKYVGKYIGKHIESRKDEDKGVRLVRYSNGARVGTTRFMFDSDGSREWRRKVQLFATMIEGGDLPVEIRWDYDGDLSSVDKVDSLEKISVALGNKRWAYKYRDFILSLP